jgi:autotransporter strand-loop-strand O-heptosyltransferase
MKKQKILFLAPHLSTGGMPQFLLKRIETLIDVFDIYVIEYQCISDIYTVQRDKIIQLIGKDRFYTLKSFNRLFLIDIIKENDIQIVHLENEAEGFDLELMNHLYSDDRKYKIVETCHNISFNPETKQYYPDAFAFCTPYHSTTFKGIDRYKKVIEYPIVKKHVDDEEKLKFQRHLGLNKDKINILNVGLWTEGKNQKEGLEIARKYPEIDFHFVGNQAENFKNYWQPLMIDLPKNVKVWGERYDVDVFMKACDVFMFNSVYECMPIVIKEAIGYGMKIYAHNLPQYIGTFDRNISEDMEYILETLVGSILELKNPFNLIVDTSDCFKIKQIDFYKEVMSLEINPQPESDYRFIEHFVDNPYFEIVGRSNSFFKVQYTDKKGIIIYEKTIKCNSWVKLNRGYYTDYNVKVWENNKLVYNKNLFLKNKKVMISFESSSLGDTLAWIPYCDLFQQKHDCELIVSTFKNGLFENQYPNITFVNPATVVDNLYAKYNLGWFYDSNKEPILPNTIPLQKTACNILGLNYFEIKPKLNFTQTVIPKIPHRYVVIAPNSTSGCKEWSKENWQEVVNYLKKTGYIVVNVSKEKSYDLEHVDELSDYSLNNTMNIIHYSEFFVGLSSGLSWLAWALGKKVFMIANFTEQNHEFQDNCIRLTNKNVCHGCWNNPNFKFDKGDWNWCPINKNLPKMFECQKGITANDLINEINKQIQV